MCELIKTINEYPWTTFWTMIIIIIILSVIIDRIVEIITDTKK